MCESNAYLVKDGQETLILESVGMVKPLGDAIILRSIFGEETRVEARLKEVNLIAHRIVLESDETLS